MINDYKYSIDQNRGIRRYPRISLIALVAIGLGASGIYGALQFLNDPAPIEAVNVIAPIEPTVKTLELSLPPRATVAEMPQLPREETTLDSLPVQQQTGSTTLSKQVTASEEPLETVAITSTTLVTEQLELPAVIAEKNREKPDTAHQSEQSVPSKVSAVNIAATTEPSRETVQPEDQLKTADTTGHWLAEKVKPGDSLAKIFKRLALSANLLHRITHSGKEAKKLANIRPGEKLKVRVDQHGNFLELIHQRSPILSLQILPEGDSFSSKSIERKLEKRVAEISGTITNSLYLAAQNAGLSDSLTMELANIFGWDVDFALEIRAGDQFSLIYEEEYLDNKKYRNGSILAAEFINRGKVFRAVRYEDNKGNSSYFSPDGRSMRKAFLRAPVDFRRISSRFTKARWHPVLGKRRPHRGVDYAAATGTPIKAAGDGKVIFRGRKGGYGKAIIIKHGSQYTTLYGHMSKYRSKVKTGTRVKQGQIIGYVGKTGLATGPHLHYEFRVNGVHRNPLKVKLPAAAPIAKKYREDFKRKSKPLLAKLDLISNTMLAEAEQAQ